MEKIWKVFLVDDHDLFRVGIKFLLDQEENIEITGEASNGNEFLNKLRASENYPDIVLMDISMPEMNGIEATSIALQINSNIKIIALTMFDDQQYYQDMMQAGAAGFVLKESGSEELLNAIQSVGEGNCYFSGKIMKKIIQSHTALNKQETEKETVKFTQREYHILNLICKGLSNKEISGKIALSQRTVESIRMGLLNKTGSSNSLKLVLYAIHNKLLDDCQ